MRDPQLLAFLKEPFWPEDRDLAPIVFRSGDLHVARKVTTSGDHTSNVDPM
jgi:hypothetical protein